MAEGTLGKRIHYGSLEHESDVKAQVDLEAGVTSGNINISTVESETLEFSAASVEAQEKHAFALKAFEAKRKAKSIIVPTDDNEVKLFLRRIGEPISLFGETKGDRRLRLRTAIAAKELDAEELEAFRKSEKDKEALPGKKEVGKKEDKTFYTPASKELILARKKISVFTWEKSKSRLQEQKRRKVECEIAINYEREVAKKYSSIKCYMVNASQFGDRRPLNTVAYSWDENLIGTGSFSSIVNIWDSTTCNKLFSLIGHEERIVDIAFRPEWKSIDTSSEEVALVSGGADCLGLLWKIPIIPNEIDKTNTPTVSAVGELRGHKQRLSKVAWHPMGKHVATSSFDHSWRLWDVETCKELLLQDGHKNGVYGISFHPDGSLVATTDLDGIGRVWDVRSGKSIYSLQGHALQILSVDFSPNGFHIATGSGDHSVRVYDIRQLKCLSLIPAHSSLVSQVKFSPASGEYMVTGSFDKTIKIWSSRDFSLLKTLQGHEGKVMGIDIGRSEKTIVSCGYDRTWKLWGPDF
uniref:Pre-mRNA processing factor 4 (PRP4)-like domain-containing protein n=1 Tax=Aplanochytrium stocchinoi TaxID=215587 RepID=A0A6S8F158_9STRA